MLLAVVCVYCRGGEASIPSVPSAFLYAAIFSIQRYPVRIVLPIYTAHPSAVPSFAYAFVLLSLYGYYCFAFFFATYAVYTLALRKVERSERKY